MDEIKGKKEQYAIKSGHIHIQMNSRVPKVSWERFILRLDLKEKRERHGIVYQLGEAVPVI